METLIQWLRPIFIVAALLATGCTTFGLEAGNTPDSISDPARSRITIASFGLNGSQSVFESEAKGAAAALSRHFRGDVRSIVRFNSKKEGNADAVGIARVFNQIRREPKDPRDVLVVFLTSHGWKKGVVVEFPKGSLDLTPNMVGQLLDSTGFSHRILIVSACYSGIFESLANAGTLVITAAAPDRTSFGCQDGVRWTYFGGAFFGQALPSAATLPEAFARARALIAAREEQEGAIPSRPQIAGGKKVLALLAARQTGLRGRRRAAAQP